MRSIFLREQRYYYRENNGRKKFGKILKDKEIEYGMKKIINRYNRFL